MNSFRYTHPMGLDWMRAIVLSSLLGCWTHALALGPLDGELSINWWANELSGDPFNGTLDAGTLSLQGEGWWDQKWGLRGRANLTDIDTDSLHDPRHYSLDLKRRLFSPTDNSFVAAGLGWEKLRLESGESSNGVRLSLEGRIGLGGFASLYGESTWLPSLDATGTLDDLRGNEFETGIVFDPLPFISIRAAYRRFELEYDLTSGPGSSRSSGIILGSGIHW